MNSKLIAMTAMMAAGASAAASDAPDGMRPNPNVIVILADDLGYGDIGCYGSRFISTPNIDALAREGVRFTNAYAPASTSSPSRYSLLTGKYAWRRNVGILPADAPLTIGSDELTLPALFRRNGYATALVGKWHLGLGSPDRPVDFNSSIAGGPLDVGFDYAYFFPATNDRVPCVYIENDRVEGLDPSDPIEVSYRHKVGSDPTGKENPELLTLKPIWGHDATIVNGISRIGWMSGGHNARWDDSQMAGNLLSHLLDYVEAHKDRPFFVYYAPNNAHEPRVPSAPFRGKSAAGIYGDVIEEFDYCVGELVAALKERDLYDNTIIVVTSDNALMIKEGYDDGAFENIGFHDPYGDMRGEKYSLYEGGTRVPFVYSWPAGLDRPFEQTQRFGFLDLKSTLAGLLGFSLTEAEAADGVDGSALFTSVSAPVYREYILTQNNGGDIALRLGDWKYIAPRRGAGSELYNLAADPHELHDLSLACPQESRKFRKIIERDSLGRGK